ncbi:MAG: AAA family ATPase [Candidatus Latescibacterota bacterium]|nr:MAG: AAA family ATPase [Candidatus Latescibacterota bacterium]
MYESYYQLDEPPFGSTPDPRFLYRSQGHREALAYVAYGLFGKKGFLALTGEVGIGKTTVIRAFVHAFHPCLEVAFVLNTNVNFEEMLYLILQDFGIDVKNTSKVMMLTTLNSFLIQKFADQQNAVIIIDEAQNLAPDVLEELRLLSNLETDRQKLLQIVLVGQPELGQMLAKRSLRQLRQRIPGVLEMRPLQAREINEYIRFRLRTAGMRNGRLEFTPEAQRAIYDYSAGIPRLINQVCDRVLIRGCLEKKTRISGDMVEAGVMELQGPAPRWLSGDVREASGE